MARRKKPEHESTAEAERRRRFEQVADNATRGEKVSWERKLDNMVTLLAKLKPIEDKILDLMAEKLPLLDEVAALRKEMVKECVHPYTHLTDVDNGVVKCKFCDKSFATQLKKTK